MLIHCLIYILANISIGLPYALTTTASPTVPYTLRRLYASAPNDPKWPWPIDAHPYCRTHLILKKRDNFTKIHRRRWPNSTILREMWPTGCHRSTSSYVHDHEFDTMVSSLKSSSNPNILPSHSLGLCRTLGEVMFIFNQTNSYRN